MELIAVNKDFKDLGYVQIFYLRKIRSNEEKNLVSTASAPLTQSGLFSLTRKLV